MTNIDSLIHHITNVYYHQVMTLLDAILETKVVAH